MLNLVLITLGGLGIWFAQKMGWAGGAKLPDLVPGHPLANAALKLVLQKLIDSTTLTDVEARLAVAFRAEMQPLIAKYPQLGGVLDELTAALQAATPPPPSPATAAATPAKPAA